MQFDNLMLCSAVQFYVERFETSPRYVGVFIQAIAEGALKGADYDETAHLRTELGHRVEERANKAILPYIRLLIARPF